MPKGREYEYVTKKEFNEGSEYQNEVNSLYFDTDREVIRNAVKIDNLEKNMKKLDKKFKPKTFKR
jgi:hypothetical protein